MGNLAKAVEQGIDNVFIKWADDFGKKIPCEVTTSQIRNIYGTVKQLEMKPELNMPELLLLKPRISYAKSREKKLAELASELVEAIDKVDEGHGLEEKRKRFQRFCQGFEAILAYHRAYGDK